MADLTGKWKYEETYEGGHAYGELFIVQNGDGLTGKIIFSDIPDTAPPFVIRENLEGRLQERKVRLKGIDMDIIDSETLFDYELDSWFGILVDENTISGLSEDEQGVEGYFTFKRMKNE